MEHVEKRERFNEESVERAPKHRAQNHNKTQPQPRAREHGAKRGIGNAGPQPEAEPRLLLNGK